MARHRRAQRKRDIFVLIVGLLFIGGAVGFVWFQGHSPEATCRNAATRYKACMQQKLGPSVRELLEQKEAAGIKACIEEPKTLAMYQDCVPKEGCAAFEACMEKHFAAFTISSAQPVKK